MNPAVRNWARLAMQALAITTIVRQLRKARDDGDKLRLADAVINGLALLTAIAIIVREIRERSDDDVAEAVDKAPL